MPSGVRAVPWTSGGTSATSGTFALVELGYARVSTAKQDLDRQIEALVDAGVARERIYVDKKSGATVDRPGLHAVLEYAREGDAIVVHTLDRLGRTGTEQLVVFPAAERHLGGLAAKLIAQGWVDRQALQLNSRADA